MNTYIPLPNSSAGSPVQFSEPAAYSYESCHCCPRNCQINRTKKQGWCHSPAGIRAARAALHPWEEPCISGLHGSGTIFFSGCTLRCCFCQNYQISSEGFGKDISGTRLEEIFLELLEAVDALAPYIDIWLPDLKYYSSELSARYSSAPDYFPVASAAVKRMIKHTGPLVLEDFSENGQACQLMKRGVILRHMVLPKHKDDSIRLLHWIHDNLPEGHFLVSLMSQYPPFYQSSKYPEINRRITSYEYQKVVDAAIELGLTQGFMQEKSSAKEEYTPPFELQGI